MDFKKKSLYVLLSAVCYPFAIPPFRYFGLINVSLALFLLTLETAKGPEEAFLIGWSYGTIAFSIGLHWLFYSIHDYGAINSLLSGFLVILIASIFGFLHALQGLIFKRFFSRFSLLVRSLFGFPLILTVLSLVPYLPFTFVSLSHVNTVLVNFIPFLGTTFFLFIVAQQGSILFLCFCRQLPIRKKLFLFFYLVGIWLGSFFLGSFLTDCEGEKLNVTALQINLTPVQKWNPVLMQQQFNQYVQYSLLDTEKTELVIWPEVALPYLSTELLTFLQAQVQQIKTPLLLGRLREEQGKLFNSASLIGHNITNYDKRKLMPFGEYLPRFLTKLRRYFTFLGEDLSVGQTKPLLRLYDTSPFAVNICYETLFPALTVDSLPTAEFIVTISDDSWFKNSWVVTQHLATAQMLSLITGRYQVLVSNGGINAFIDNRGRVLQQTKATQALSGQIKRSNQIPINVRFQRHYRLVFIAFFLFMLFKAQQKNKK